MKSIKVIAAAVIILLIIATGLFLYQKYRCKPITKIHSYLIDLTDEEVLIPKYLSITKEYGFEENLFNQSVYRLKTISSYEYTQLYEYRVRKGSTIENEGQRIQVVNQFFEDIKISLDNIKENKIGTTYTVLYQPLMDEIEQIRDMEGEEKRLYVYSDLRAHPPFGGIDLYNKSTLETLLVHPEHILTQLEEEINIPPDLDGIEVYFIYESDSLNDIQIFERMAQVLGHALKDRGALVFVKSKF